MCIAWVTFDELLMLFMDLNMNPCYVTPLFIDLYLCFPPYKGLLLQTIYQYKGTRAKLFYCHEMSLK